MQRIIIVGNSGSGKSTLARQMSEILEIPAVHADILMFFENQRWVARPRKEYRAKIFAAIAADKWIFDGAAGTSTLPQRIERCDTIIFFDFNRFFCLYRVIKRRIQIRKKPRPEVPKGCIDCIDLKFLKWVLLGFPNRRQEVIEKIYASGKPIHHFKKRKQVARFTNELKEI